MRNTSARIRDLIRRCLTKNPRQRLRDIGEARIAIEELVAGGYAAELQPPTGTSRFRLARLRTRGTGGDRVSHLYGCALQQP